MAKEAQVSQTEWRRSRARRGGRSSRRRGAVVLGAESGHLRPRASAGSAAVRPQRASASSMTPELLVSHPPVAILAHLLIVDYWLEIVTRSIMVEVQAKLACRCCSQCGCSASASASAPAL
jgi:hypothetical protein